MLTGELEPHEMLPSTLGRLISSCFAASQPHYQRTTLHPQDAKTYALIFRQLLTVLGSIGAAYVWAALSNDYFNNPDPEQRPRIPEDQLIAYRDTAFFCNMFANTCISKWCLDGVLSSLSSQKRSLHEPISALTMVTQYQQSMRVLFLRRFGQLLRIVLTIAAFFLSLSNLRAFSFTFNNCLRILSCAINIPINWMSLLQFEGLWIFQWLLYGRNTRIAHANNIARALQDYIEEQRIKCENQGYDASLRQHNLLQLSAIEFRHSPQFTQLEKQFEEDPKISDEIKTKIRLLHSHITANDPDAYLLERIRLCFHVLTVGTTNSAEDSISEPLLPKPEADRTSTSRKIVNFFGALVTGVLKGYYVYIVCIASGFGYPADAAMAIKQIWFENQWSFNDGFQVLFWSVFLINAFVSSGLSYSSGLATFNVLLSFLKDIGQSLCYKLPRQLGARGSTLFGKQWHSVVSLEYHLAKSERFCNIPIVWLMATLLLVFAAAGSGAANAYVNEVSLVPFAVYIGLNNIFSMDILNAIKDHLTLTALAGAFAVNYFYSSLFLISVMITLLYFGKMDLRNEIKREVRETSSQRKTLASIVSNLSPPFVDLLVSEELGLLPEKVVSTFPQPSVAQFRGMSSLRRSAQPLLSGEEQNATETNDSNDSPVKR